MGCHQFVIVRLVYRSYDTTSVGLFALDLNDLIVVRLTSESQQPACVCVRVPHLTFRDQSFGVRDALREAWGEGQISPPSSPSSSIFYLRPASFIW